MGEFCRSRRVLPQRVKADVDNTMRDLQNSSYPTKSELNNLLFIQNISPFLKESGP